MTEPSHPYEATHYICNCKRATKDTKSSNFPEPLDLRFPSEKDQDLSSAWRAILFHSRPPVSTVQALWTLWLVASDVLYSTCSCHFDTIQAMHAVTQHGRCQAAGVKGGKTMQCDADPIRMRRWINPTTTTTLNAT